MNNAIINSIINDIKTLKQALKQLTTLSARAEVAGSGSRVFYAELPTPGKIGRFYYCYDACKDGEPSGSGTGAYIYDDGTNFVYFDRPTVVVTI